MEIDQNIRNAFQGVKKDILEIKNQLLVLTENQEKIEAKLEESKKKVKNNSDSNSGNGLVQISEAPKESAKKSDVKKTSKKASKKKK